ncbi:hypothetical protein [Streptomyces sp. CAU 1734]|uniref:hypothetical protein n=1 Tax=Streptomyces sp. CAU 1734 TaxID=3140360 RepID=UPI0032604E9E
MARLHVRTGVDPEEPDTPVVTLLADPDGPPGDRVVARLADHCYEGDEVLYLVRTDGWAEHSLDGGRLTVTVVLHPAVLARTGADLADFPEHPPAHPAAVVVLRAETAVDPELYARAAPVTAAFTMGPDDPSGDPLSGPDDWPVLLALPPE